MQQIPEYEHLLGRFFPSLRSRKTKGHKVARFRQVNLDQIGVHHDALEFPNGKTVLIAELLLGQQATVLQLPAQGRIAAAEEEQAASEQPTERATVDA